jgi:hypothetical protein
MRAPVNVVHMELIGRSGHVGGVQTVIFKAFRAALIDRPNKNEDDTRDK